MRLKPFSSQISIFLSDGIMNPGRIADQINTMFKDLFDKEDYRIVVEDAPNEMPLVRYSSKNGKYCFEFAKKRLNFFMYFEEKDSLQLFEEYKGKITTIIEKIILINSDISRIGIAINYYIDQRDDKIQFWVKKYDLPFYTNDTSEVSYTINNNFIFNGLKFNKILNISNGKINNTKMVPVVSIDINNLSTAKMSEEWIHFIMKDMDFYRENIISEVLNERDEQ